jgi:transcription initiation factor IIE alpha subunit
MADMNTNGFASCQNEKCDWYGWSFQRALDAEGPRLCPSCGEELKVWKEKDD